MKDTLIVFFLLSVFSTLTAGQTSPLQRIESSMKDAELIFDGKPESFVTVRSGDYAAILFSRPLRLSKCVMSAAVDGLFKVRVLTSRDAVNWTSRETTCGPVSGTGSFSLTLPPGPAEYLSLEFESARSGTLSLSEVRIEEKPEAALTVDKVKVVFSRGDPFGKRSALIKWVTPVETTGQVRYGRKTADKVASELVFRKEHGIEIDGLKPGRSYQFEIIASDGLKTYRKGSQTFKVPGVTDIEVEDLRAFPISWDRTEIIAVSSTPARLSLYYTGTNQDDSGKRSGVRTTLTNSAVLSNLLPETGYRLVAILMDAKGRVVTNRSSFVTPVRDVALGKPATGTFTNRTIGDSFELEGDVLPRVTDGVLDYRTGMAVSGDPASGDQWFTVDLGRIWPVDRVVLSFRSLCYPRDFSLSFSPDGAAWTQVAERLDAGTGTDGLSASGDPMKIVSVDGDGRPARFVRFFMKKGASFFRRFDFYRFVQIFEAQVVPLKG